MTFGDDQYGVTIVDYRYNVLFNDGSTAPRTLYTPIFEFDNKTNVTGLFNLKLPQARTITLNCQVNAIQNWMHGVGAQCRVPAEGITLNPNGSTTDWFSLGHFSDGVPFDFSIDLTSVAGKDVEVILKAQANYGVIPGLFHWTKAEVACEFDAAQGYDLSVCPSDFKIVPQADPSHVKLRFLVRNVGNAESPGFDLTLSKRSDGSQLTTLQGTSIPAGGSEWLEYYLPVSSSAKTVLGLLCRVTASTSGEGMTGNNDASFNVHLPCYALTLKRIDGLPKPWKADELNVVFSNSGVGGGDYSLSYTLKDFWGKSLVVNKSVALPSTVGFTTVGIDLRPSLGSLLGWFEAEIQLRHSGNVVDTRSINISRIAPRPSPLSPLTGIQTFFWLYSDDEASKDLELIRDMGARYVRCNGVDRTEELLAQGNGEYVMTYIPNNSVDAINSQGYTEQIRQQIYNDMFALVDQFKGRVKYYELGNEYNTYISAANCALMYETIYDAAKAADPNCIVNTGGLGGGQQEAWFQSFYGAARNHIDNVSLHSYTLWAVPDRNELLMEHCNQPVQNYIDILGADYPAKNIWISEYGWFAKDSTTRDLQAQNTVRQYLLGARYSIPMIQFLLLDAGYDNSRDGVNVEGLCFFNREPKPAYAAYAALARQLSGASFVGEKPLGSNCFAYVFQKQGSRFMYLWKSVAPEEVLTLPALGSSVTVTDMMGNSKSVAASSSGMVSLPLSYYPICVSGLDIDGFVVIDREIAYYSPDAAQYLGVPDYAPGWGGVQFWDISATTPAMTCFLNTYWGSSAPYAVAFGPRNDVFATCPGSTAIYRAPYEGNGRWTDAWTVAFTTPSNAEILAYDSIHNRMYVNMPGTSNLFYYNFDTATSGTVALGLQSASALAVVGNKLWMGFSGATVIGRLDTTTGINEAMNATYPNSEWPDLVSDGTWGVCGAPDGSTGSAYYTGWNLPRIMKYQVNSTANWDRTNNHYTVFENDSVNLPSPLGIAIGTDRNGDGVRDFFVADHTRKIVVLSGTDGAYISTFADNPAIWYGVASAGGPRHIAVTAGNTAGLPLDTPVELASLSVGKTVADGEFVHITETIATSSLSDMAQCFYIEEPDRSCGMRVVPQTVIGSLQRGSIVDVYGTMGTTTAGERQIVDAIVYVVVATTALDPVGMNNKTLGGGDFEDPIHNQGQYGVPGGTGTNNIGLLVRVWGEVIDFGDHYVVIDDGSGVSVRVDTTAAPSTPLTGYIAVTGMSSLYGTKPNGTRLILALSFTTEATAIAKPADGVSVEVRGAVVTAAFPDVFYIESDTREAGIRVQKLSHGLAVGSIANTAGPVRTNANGERYIDASTVTAVPLGVTIDPLGMTNKALGGGDWLYNAVTKAGQKGITGAVGLNNIGLLMAICGKVTASGRTWFYLDDGSNVQDGTGTTGIYCEAQPGIIVPAVGSYVSVTGISSCELYSSRLVNVLLVRDQSGINEFLAASPLPVQGPRAASVDTRPRDRMKPD